MLFYFWNILLGYSLNSHFHDRASFPVHQFIFPLTMYQRAIILFSSYIYVGLFLPSLSLSLLLLFSFSFPCFPNFSQYLLLNFLLNLVSLTQQVIYSVFHNCFFLKFLSRVPAIHYF